MRANIEMVAWRKMQADLAAALARAEAAEAALAAAKERTAVLEKILRECSEFFKEEGLKSWQRDIDRLLSATGEVTAPLGKLPPQGQDPQ